MRYIEGRCYVCNRDGVSKEQVVCSELCEAIQGLIGIAVKQRLLDEGYELVDQGKG